MNTSKRSRNSSALLRTVMAVLMVCHLPLVGCHAQTIREAFKAMPDSLTPYLTANNKLDMMDFLDAKMKAKVTNKLGGETEMTFLGEDTLAVRMSDALLMEMKMQTAGTDTVVCLKRTYQTHGGYRQVIVSTHNPTTWEELSSTMTESTLFRLEEKVAPNTTP